MYACVCVSVACCRLLVAGLCCLLDGVGCCGWALAGRRLLLLGGSSAGVWGSRESLSCCGSGSAHLFLHGWLHQPGPSPGVRAQELFQQGVLVVFSRCLNCSSGRLPTARLLRISNQVRSKSYIFLIFAFIFQN